eukprot:gene12004-12148_t
MHRTLLHDGFKVLETSGPAESVELLGRITRFLNEMYASQTGPGGSSNLQSAASGTKGGSALGSDSSGGGAGGGGGGLVLEVLEAWNSRVSSSRKTKTVRQKWQELLLTVSGIGVEAVLAIVSIYPTPISLFWAYEATIQAALAAGHNATGAAQALLCDVCQASGQRVGPAKSKHVYDKLFANGWNVTGHS